MNFDHYTDDAVRLAVELVNTLDAASGEEKLDSADELQRLVEEYGYQGEVGTPDLAAARRIRTRLRQVFEAPDAASAASMINRLLDDVRAIPRVSVHDGVAPHMHFEPPTADAARWLGAASAMALAMVLCEHGKERLGVCGAHSCRDVYVDASKNRARRYCSDTCCTRENVAAYRRRKQGR